MRLWMARYKSDGCGGWNVIAAETRDEVNRAILKNMAEEGHSGGCWVTTDNADVVCGVDGKRYRVVLQPIDQPEHEPDEYQP